MKRMPIVIVVLAGAAALVAANVGGSGPSAEERRSQAFQTLLGSAAGAELAAAAERARRPRTMPARLTFDGSACATTLPRRWRAGTPLELGLVNASEERAQLIVGRYDDGFGRADMLAHGREADGARRLRVPFFAADLVRAGLAAGDEAERRLELEPGRYYFVCLSGLGTRMAVAERTLVVE